MWCHPLLAHVSICCLDAPQAMQRVIFAALAAATLLNMGTVLWVSAVGGAAKASFVGAAVFAAMTLKNFIKVAQLEKKELQLAGAA